MREVDVAAAEVKSHAEARAVVVKEQVRELCLKDYPGSLWREDPLDGSLVAEVQKKMVTEGNKLITIRRFVRVSVDTFETQIVKDM